MVDQTSIQQLIVSAIWTIPLITGLVQIIKTTKAISDRWIPVLSICIGVFIGMALIQPSIAGATAGLVLGLGASGLWDFGRVTVAGKV